MGVENIIAGNGVAIAVVGMAVVFAGLVLISVLVAALPRALDRGDQARAWGARTRERARERARARTRAGTGTGAGGTGADGTPADGSLPGGDAKAARPAAHPDGLDPDLLAAIAFVVEAERERERSQDHQRITIRDGEEQRVWTAIGKMRTLSTRL